MLHHTAALYDDEAGRWLLFGEPVRILAAHDSGDVAETIARVEEAVGSGGLYAAGFIAYEAAPAFDPALIVRSGGACPLVHFGLYDRVETCTDLPAPSGTATAPAGWTPSVTRGHYDEAVAAVKDRIARGETYQVNYTFRLHAPFSGDDWALFRALARMARPTHGAYVDAGRFAVLSLSPELFFDLTDGRLTACPMKGTMRRGRTNAEDDAARERLLASEKDRAENVMIVDMLRNDMGRIAGPGSVAVPALFDVERHAGVWQMTSTVTARTEAGLADVLAALFPCASVTGAPKVSTMGIIAGLETTPRNVYTGCVGYVAPGGRARFNVAIRTVLVDRAAGMAEYGVGGGIVWDSTSAGEYAECADKARVVTGLVPPFSLLETLLWTPGDGWFLLERHIRRLLDTARYFAYPCDATRVRRELAAAVSDAAGARRVRLLVDREGGVTCEACPINAAAGDAPVRLGLAAGPVDSTDPFLYHKTTNRRVYEEARAARPGCDDVLLFNEWRQVTESTIANVVVKLDGGMVTPPVSCGLLGGTFRAELLDAGTVAEGVVTLDGIARADEVWLVNSVRSWLRAVLV